MKKAQIFGGRLLPTKCEMPDLSQLENLIPSFLPSLFGDGTVDERITPDEQRHYRVFVRLTNKAYGNYQAARDEIVYFLQAPGIGRIYHIVINFVDLMENCLDALRRLYGVVSAVKRKRGHVLKIDRPLRHVLDGNFDELKRVRDVVVHLEEKIERGEWSGSVFLKISDDDRHVGVQDYWISFEELATLMRTFHEVCISWRNVFINR